MFKSDATCLLCLIFFGGAFVTAISFQHTSVIEAYCNSKRDCDSKRDLES